MAAKAELIDLFMGLQNEGTPLSTFQRVLLMTDGTVTDVLEVYAGEAIRVVILDQRFEDPSSDPPELNAEGAERLLHRTVLLQGAISGTNFIHAESVIAPDRLPSEILEGLLETGRPIGRLLNQGRIETFREIVGVGYEPAGDCAAYFGIETTANLVSRTYRIHVAQRPVMRITEKFPTTWFSQVVEL
jgi:chorismate-pyruvate lyase